MLYDRLSHSGNYILPEMFYQAFDHCRSLNSSSATGVTRLSGDDLIVSISEYHTLPRENAKAESHRKYIDIHMLLSGRETLLWYPTGLLPLEKAYDEERDVLLYKHAGYPVGAQLDLIPGLFVIFYPWDIHLTQSIYGNKRELVKKAVYKIAIDSLEEYIGFQG